jgi:hypothetical protein
MNGKCSSAVIVEWIMDQKVFARLQISIVYLFYGDDGIYLKLLFSLKVEFLFFGFFLQ